jgi:hypothetical protein
MGLKARVRRLWRRTPVRVGSVGGVVTALAGIVGYVVVPVLTGAQPSFTSASIAAVDAAVPYHAAVLVVPPFVAALVGTLVVRRRGFSGRRVDATVVGGIVGGPLVTVLLTYFATAFAFGAAAGVRAGGLGDAVIVTVGFAFWALLFGFFFLLVAFPAVGVVEGTAATVGYLCARGLWRVVREEEAGGSATDGDPEDGTETAPDRSEC